MTSNNIFSDDPIGSVNEDLLGRDRFASQIVKVCETVSKDSPSSVISLVGDWGSGKSSILELVKLKLDTDSWYVAEYNPWLLSDTQTMVRSFFNEIINAIPKESRDKNIRKTIGKYAKFVSPLGSIAVIWGLPSLEKIFSRIGDSIEGDTSLSEAKSALSKVLNNLERPVIVIMDDLDRLHPDELMMVFKLVRLVGRLPNLYYIMSYDEATLISVIAETELAKKDEVRARAYLEKIVQVRLDTPKMIDIQRDELVNESFDKVLKANKISLSDDDLQVFSRAYHNCIKYYLQQPRAIKRYFSQIQSLYPLVKNEVNFTDFALITFIRTFEPNAYKLILENKDELTGQSNGFGEFSEESNEQRKVRWLKKIKDVNVIRHTGLFELFASLFVPIKNARDNSSYANAYADLHDNKGVGHRYYFDRYFIYGVYKNDISDQTVDEALEALRASKSSKSLNELKKALKLNPRITLAKLEKRESQGLVPPEQTIRLLAEFYLKAKTDDDFFAHDAQWAMQAITDKILQKLPKNRANQIITEVANSQEGLLLIGRAYNFDEEKQQKWMKDSKDILSKAIDGKLKSYNGKKLSTLSKDGFNLIYLHKYFKGAENTKQWLWERIEQDGWDILGLLALMTSEGTSYGDRVRKVIGELSSQNIDEFFGMDKVLLKLENKLKNFNPTSTRDLQQSEPTTKNKKLYILNKLKIEQAKIQETKNEN